MTDQNYIEKPTYRSEIIAAFRALGGQGSLKDIYAAIQARGVLPAIRTNPNWQAQVRKQLQADSSDASTQSSGKDIFFSANGLHNGVWGIRDLSLLESDETFDFSTDGEFRNEQIVEGAQKVIKVNAFERSRFLRRQSINLFGCFCQVCYFDFEHIYGVRGKGFIEVHHIVPLSEIRQSYTANPADLRPVCPNCHSIIHRFKPFLTIAEMSDLLALQRRMM
jgi:5-methylcytosine-specific restriction protein A